MKTLPAKLSVLLLASFFSFALNVARADIAYDNVSSEASTSEGTTLSWSHTIGSGENRILIVGVGCEDQTPGDMGVSSVTYNGVAMDFVAGSSVSVGSSYYQKTDMYYMLDDDLPSAGTYTVIVTHAGTVNDRSGGAISLTGVAQAAREAVATNSNSSSSTISTDITTLTDGAWLVDVVGCGNPGSFSTDAAGMTERWDVEASSSSTAGATKPVASAGLATMAWQHSSSGLRLAHSVAAFAPASDGLEGDLDLNGAVDTNDLGLFCAQWLDAGCSGPGCADLDGTSGVDFADLAILLGNWTGPLPSPTISGYVKTSGASGIPDVTVSADNGGGSDSTDSSGYYSVAVSSGWSGRVTPSKAGYDFTPTYRDYSNVTSDRTNEDYTGALQTLTISGYVKTSGGSGISGVTVSADSGGSSDSTDSSGYYSVTVPYGWTGRVTPTKDYYTFSPPYIEYFNLTSSQTNQNYIGTYDSFDISGHIKTSGDEGISGVDVSADNGGGSDTTDSAGYYSVAVPSGWSGRVTPTRAGYDFSPLYKDYSNVTSNQTNQDYTGTAQAFTIVINEVMASNRTTVADDQNEFDDWIELYNGSGSPIDIAGMYITDDLNNPDKYQMPTGYSSQTTIDGYGFLILWADGEPDEGPLHLDFQLGKSGEDAGLFESDLTMVDGMSFGEQVGDISYGRYPNGSGDFKYMGVPTPNAVNVDGYAGLVDEVEISHVHGFYDSSFDVELFCEDGEADIWYTTDGNTPDADAGIGTIYSGTLIPITTTTCLRARAFRTGYIPSTSNAATYIFLADVKDQSDGDAYARGFPVLWEGPSEVNNGDYAMDPDVVYDGAYEPLYGSAMKAVPTISLVIDMEHLFDKDTGIYVNTWEFHDPEGGEDWERPVSVEYFDPCTGQDFQINAGIRLVGNDSRNTKNPKHSFRLTFTPEYGPTKLDFLLFENTDVQTHNTIAIRSQYHIGWVQGASNAQFTRDMFAADSIRDMGYLTPDSRFVHLYINGLYWGLYQASERPDNAFMAQYMGGEPEDYEVVEGVYPGYPTFEWKGPGDQTWSYIWNYITAGNDYDNPVSSGEYEVIEQYIDMTQMVDYIIYMTYAVNWDWNAKNWYAASFRGIGSGPPAGKWMFYPWDSEITLQYHYQMQDIPFSGYQGAGPGKMHNSMHKNSKYNRLFGDRIHKLLFHDGVMTQDNSIDRYQDRAEQIEIAVIAESARWGDYARDEIRPGDPLYTKNGHWTPQRDWLVNTFFPGKAGWIVGHYEDEGLYPSVAAPSFSQQGGEISGGGSVTITGGGTIYYTTDGTEPMDYGSTISSGSSVTINHSLTLKARSYYGGTDWSALNEATFAVGSIVDDLRITEMMYHPPSVEGVDYNDPNHEFIELKNIGSGTLNLNLVKFTEGIDFTFGNMTLAAGDHVLVVKNISAFETKYGGGKNIAGEWTGPRGGILSNAGERIRLEDAIGRVILDFSYADGWRKNTDGEGFSLNIVDEDADADLWNDKANWAASKYKGGTPDADDSALLAEHSIAINEILAHQDTAPGDWIELKNTTGGSIDIGGWYVSDDDANLLKYRIKLGTVLNADAYLLLTEDANFGPNSVDPAKDVNFALSEHGETVYLTSAEGSQLTGYREQEDFDASENGVAFGRHQKSTGTFNFVAMSSNTPGSANASPKVGPIVITEIMYNPESGGQNAEYVELYNTTSSTVYLYENVDGNDVPWKFTDGIKYTFDADANIPGYGRMLVVKTSPSYFKTTLYSVPGGVQVVGPYYGFLSNSGEKLELGKTGEKDEQGVQHYVRMDRVVYSDGYHPDNPWESDPWPTSPDAGGKSLERISTSGYGNDVANWQADNPSPGS